jgi:hypothetical protein
MMVCGKLDGGFRQARRCFDRENKNGQLVPLYVAKQ